MDIKPILGYDELRSMLMVGHEYVPEKRFLDTARALCFMPPNLGLKVVISYTPPIIKK